MYWIRGSINVSVQSPTTIDTGDFQRFEDWMRRRGWIISDNLHLDPMSEDYAVSHPNRVGMMERWEEDIGIWESQENIPYHLMRLYEEMGLVRNGEALPLCEFCPSCQVCWNGIEHKKPTGLMAHVSLPWVGERYNKLRILVLGINPYEGGGLDFYPRLIPEAIEELKVHTKVNFNHEGYGGTLLWHRIGLYAAVIVAAYHHEDIDLAPDEAYSYIAFSNHIKCSPVGDRSAPSSSMWEQCGSLLRRELAILKPNVIVVVGRGDNWHSITHNVLDAGVVILGETHNVRLGSGTIANEQVGLINVPHPSAPNGGSSYEVVNALRKLLLVHRRELSEKLQHRLWFVR